MGARNDRNTVALGASSTPTAEQVTYQAVDQAAGDLNQAGRSIGIVSDVQYATVLTYDAVTRKGTAQTLTRGIVSFVNAPQHPLFVGAAINVADVKTVIDWVVVGMLSSYATPPVAAEFPSGQIDETLPLRTLALPAPFGLHHVNNTSTFQKRLQDVVYDVSGALGLGADTIIGLSQFVNPTLGVRSATGEIAGCSRQRRTSFLLGAGPSSLVNDLAGGTLLSVAINDGVLLRAGRVDNPTASHPLVIETWSYETGWSAATQVGTAGGSFERAMSVTQDFSAGKTWCLVYDAAAYDHYFIGFSGGTHSSLGKLGTPTAVEEPIVFTHLGKLYCLVLTAIDGVGMRSYDLYRKSSVDFTSFVKICEFEIPFAPRQAKVAITDDEAVLYLVNPTLADSFVAAVDTASGTVTAFPNFVTTGYVSGATTSPDGQVILFTADETLIEFRVLAFDGVTVTQLLYFEDTDGSLVASIARLGTKVRFVVSPHLGSTAYNDSFLMELPLP